MTRLYQRQFKFPKGHFGKKLLILSLENVKWKWFFIQRSKIVTKKIERADNIASRNTIVTADEYKIPTESGEVGESGKVTVLGHWSKLLSVFLELYTSLSCVIWFKINWHEFFMTRKQTHWKAYRIGSDFLSGEFSVSHWIWATKPYRNRQTNKYNPDYSYAIQWHLFQEGVSTNQVSICQSVSGLPLW